MGNEPAVRIAILYPGDYETRQSATVENNRFAQLFQALADLGVDAQPAVYHPDFWQEVSQQLLQVDGVLVWVNPIQDGHDRAVLDSMLKDIADKGIFVSAQPDIILKMGTKEVLYQTRHMGWGCDTHLLNSLEQMRQELPVRLAAGAARVLKQYRGNGGSGVWKVELAEQPATDTGVANPDLDTPVWVRHAQRGSTDETMPLADFFRLCEPYFTDSGRMIDQAYQSRLPEGMIRCYLAQETVVGFGHQAINALYPTPSGSHPGEAVQPGPRLYHPPSLPEFQPLKRKLEQEWVPELQQILAIPTDDLPIIWDADFLLGPKDASGEDTYVLCEINVSSVAPYPDSAVLPMALAALARTQAAQYRR
ncbi:MAG: Cj0069 family protein [Anaerolineae bacterium]|nr:Cj0069 family protein [Anaerolineae bacterium]